MAFLGEWWFIDGRATFADGDVADRNHSSLVYEEILSDLCCLFDIEGEFEGDVCAFIDEYNLRQDSLSRSTGKDVDTIYAQDKQEVVEFYGDREKAHAAWDCIFGRSSVDPRVYAVRYLDWVRVTGMYLQVWTLTKKAVECISSGLEDTHDLEDILDTEFYIEEVSTGRVFDTVPATALLDARMSEIFRCRQDTVLLSAPQSA